MRVPDHTRAAVARLAAVHTARPIAALLLVRDIALARAAGAHGFLHRRVHRVELMVARDDLVQRAVVRVFLEDDEMLEQIEQALPLEHPSHQHLQLQRRFRRVLLAVDGAPDLEPLLTGRERTDARLHTVRHHQQLVVVQQ
jgi:hypothetical protein